MELLIAIGIAAGLAAAAYFTGSDSRTLDLDRVQPWWPGRRLGS